MKRSVAIGEAEKVRNSAPTPKREVARFRCNVMSNPDASTSSSLGKRKREEDEAIVYTHRDALYTILYEVIQSLPSELIHMIDQYALILATDLFRGTSLCQQLSLSFGQEVQVTKKGFRLFREGSFSSPRCRFRGTFDARSGQPVVLDWPYRITKRGHSTSTCGRCPSSLMGRVAWRVLGLFDGSPHTAEDVLRDAHFRKGDEEEEDAYLTAHVHEVLAFLESQGEIRRMNAFLFLPRGTNQMEDVKTRRGPCHLCSYCRRNVAVFRVNGSMRGWPARGWPDRGCCHEFCKACAKNAARNPERRCALCRMHITGFTWSVKRPS